MMSACANAQASLLGGVHHASVSTRRGRPVLTARSAGRGRKTSVKVQASIQPSQPEGRDVSAKAYVKRDEPATISAAEQFVQELAEAEKASQTESLQLKTQESTGDAITAAEQKLIDVQNKIDALYESTFSALKIRPELLPGLQPSADGAAQKHGPAGGNVQSLFRGQQQASASSAGPASAPAAADAAAGVAPSHLSAEELAADLQRRLDAFRQTRFDEARFSQLGRDDPLLFEAVLSSARGDKKAWLRFQQDSGTLSLQRDRARAQLEAAQAASVTEARRNAQRTGRPRLNADRAPAAPTEKTIVLISGFESFNVKLYKDVARRLSAAVPGVSLEVFSDRDLESRRGEVEAALARADAFFGSLLFDFDQVEWLRPRLERIPVRLVFESALELMSSTQVGTFNMKTKPGEKKAGPPPAVKALLAKFGSGKEEDRMVGYLSFLKIGPKLLSLIPGDKVRDLRNWLTVYSFWNQGGAGNVESAFRVLVNEYVRPAALSGKPASVPALSVTPDQGCYHPDREMLKLPYIVSPSDYLAWYRATKNPPPDAPVVAVLLYRKHVITRQPYLNQLVYGLEEQGLIPVPIFINGIEAHTVVRDSLTTAHEQRERAVGNAVIGSLKPNAISVDAVVSTIGFPLVGGPAGSMEAGRQADVAKTILSAKNVPYVVASPTLIQELASWQRDGVGGLQSVVMYALPELDGAVDTVALGGLVKDDLYLCKERVIALGRRLNKWISLRRSKASDRKIAIVLYGFPPGVGSVGTAALLNVPSSLDAVLARLRADGYDLGTGTDFSAPLPSGEAIVSALRRLDDAAVVSGGLAGADAAIRQQAEESADPGLALCRAGGAEVGPAQLREWLRFPDEWGPTEWGPIPTLPEPDRLVRQLEKQWGSLDSYAGIRTAFPQAGGGPALVVSGIQLGNVFIGVQPVLGLEGDPMRLLFERDLTPHPQYAAFYKWLQSERGFNASAVVHFGMHGTVEWLPGSPLGNTGLSWSDVLLGPMPNVYVYAANNPSESIVAKRRGYGTIVSYNVPPYGRSGLYKQLADLRALLQDLREDKAGGTAEALRGPIAGLLSSSGLWADVPLRPGDERALSPEEVESLSEEAFAEYADRLYQYLGTLENRLFSSGLHSLGKGPGEEEMRSYLSAYFGKDLPEEAVGAIAAGRGREAALAALERAYAAPSAEEPAARPPLDKEAAASRLPEAEEIFLKLQRTTEELDGFARALRGEYVLPEAGGDLLRDGPGVLPTGRNIHALDPYRMPSPAAFERGAQAGRAILEQHRAANGGAYPETVSVNLWGLDAIKTKGESVALALHLVGARPVKEGTGRIVRFELIPLAELGRPRVDVLCNMSGIFRDSFANVVALLDDLFERAAGAEGEPVEMNFVRKHAEALRAKGVEAASARLFSNPPGDYGSMVNERIGAGNWDQGAELGETWVSRNAFSYGKGAERGTARPEVLRELLSTTDRVVQQIDSVEYGLTDIQEYYANTGALLQAARSAKEQAGGDAARVGCSIVEAFEKEVKPKELVATLRMEYRTKLLNPKWAEAMASQGSGGAFEISQRMTALVGWGATADFTDNWVWDGSYETYVEDEEMAARLRKANPQAFSNVVRRMLEGAGRGFWDASEEKLEKLRELYGELDQELEGIKA